MKSFFKIFEKVKNQAGVTAVVVAIVLPMLIAFGALGVDVGYMCVAKNELQNVADAAALAATRKLGTIYQGMTPGAQQAYICGIGDIALIKGVADAVAHKNKAGGEHITVHDMTEGIEINEVEIGNWNSSDIPPSFTATDAQPDAVRVTARRDGSANGPITTFFAKIFGIDTVDVSADATAALTGQTTSEPGEIELPLGISTLIATPDKCDKDIKFSPTADACAGWNTFFISPSNDVTVRNILEGMRDGSIESPATTSGEDEFDFTGGKLSDPTFDALLLLFKDKGYDINEDGEAVATYVDDGTPVTGHLDADELVRLAGLTPPDAVNINGPLVPFYGTDKDGLPIRLYYPDGVARNVHEWPTKVVVYEEEGPDCGNPSGLTPIVGYATILLTDVLGPPLKEVWGKLECELVSKDDTRGGGGDYGTKGNIPCLVE